VRFTAEEQPMRQESSSRKGCIGSKFSVLSAALFLWASPAASLPVTYLDTGLLFTDFVTPYDGSMSIDGSVTFSTALPANLTLQNFTTNLEASGGTYSFFDGVTTYDPSNSTPNDLLFSTDKNANITAWQVEIFSNAGPIILLQNLPSVPDPGFDKVLSSAAQQMALTDGPATWDVTPEPSVLTLSALGISLLAAGARRRSS
jgi:hypothetical protein